MARDPDLTDKVITYVVNFTGVADDSYKQVSNALDDGFRVVDVLQTAQFVGGAVNGYGSVIVTVVMTKSPGSCPMARKHV